MSFPGNLPDSAVFPLAALSISLHIIQILESFSQLCKMKGEERNKRREHLLCALFVFTVTVSESRTVKVCSVGCNKLCLFAVIFQQILGWHIYALVWGLIKPMSVEVNDFDWIH